MLLPEFDSTTKSGVERLVKPIFVFTVDGGPDENPPYHKVIKVAIHHFVKHDLDALFIATNAPGRSASNRVERKMAPLSKELSGQILPHDHFGSHLDNRGQTIDLDLEEKNFAFAGTVLAEIWSKMVEDNFPMVAEYVNPGTSELLEAELLNKDQNWCDVHIRSSQYFIQIVKCADPGAVISTLSKKDSYSNHSLSFKRARDCVFQNVRTICLRTLIPHLCSCLRA